MRDEVSKLFWLFIMIISFHLDFFIQTEQHPYFKFLFNSLFFNPMFFYLISPLSYLIP